MHGREHLIYLLLCEFGQGGLSLPDLIDRAIHVGAGHGVTSD
jgi:hypothetical protein